MGKDSRGPWEGLTLQGGRYRQLKTIGTGGMGCVYRAVDSNLKSYVVIKTPQSSLIDDSQSVERFEREIAALVRLSYPHIVPVIDFARHDGVVYAVMRYLSGGSLETRILTSPDGVKQPLASSGLRDWLPNIVKALDFVHGSKYVHRDVKPANILFDSGGQAYLSDFGIVKLVGEKHKVNAQSAGDGTVLGTVDYMAPELLAGEAFDHRVDQYALAVTIYEVLAGRLPFDGASVAEIAQAQLNQIPRPIHELVHTVSRPLSDAVARALSKRPEHRYANCTEFARAVLAAADAARQNSGAPAAVIANRQSTTAQGVGGRSSPAQSLSAQARQTTQTAAASKPAAQTARDTDRIAMPTKQVAAPLVAEVVVPRAKASRLPIIVGSCIALLLLVGGAFLVRSDLSEAESSGLGANQLPRKISEWKKRADEAEKSLIVDSDQILKMPEYADAAGLESQLNKIAAERVAAAGKELDGLTADLSTMASLLDERRAAIKKLSESSEGTTDAAKTAAADQDRELRDQESQILTAVNQLNAMRRTSQSPRGAYDPEAVAELAILRDMEAVAGMSTVSTIDEKTLDRAGMLLNARNPDLAFRAWNVLARAGDSRALAQLNLKFDAATVQRQADLLLSLLSSGRAESIDAAAIRLDKKPQLFELISHDSLLMLGEDKPATYQRIFTPLAAQVKNGDVRFRLAVVQTRVMNEAWSDELSEACRNGLLKDRVGDLVGKIIADRSKAAYPLAERLLAEHPKLTFAGLTGDEFAALERDAPKLAELLGEAWIMRGTPAQRAASLAGYGKADSTISAKRLFERLKQDRPTDPTSLINTILPREMPRTVELAEQLLVNSSGLNAAELAFATASSELRRRPAARKVLFQIAWENEKAGRAWVMRELLGAEFERRFGEVEAERDRQLKTLQLIAPVLSGKLIAKGVAAASVIKTYQLPIPKAEVAKLTSSVQPADWAPQSAAARNLAEMRVLVEAAKERAEEPYRPALGAFVGYLAELEELTNTARELAGVYDVTIVQQLPGALRGMKLNNLPTWDFLFLQSQVDAVRREEVKYRSLSASLPAARAALLWSSESVATTAPQARP